MFDNIKILFFGLEWGRADIYGMGEDGIRLLKQISGADAGTDASARILGLEAGCGSPSKDRLVDFFMKNIDEKVAAVYVTVDNERQIGAVKDAIGQFLPGEAEVYGIDPDYFFSLVPLECTGRKAIEKYILGLKMDFSARARVKQAVKNLLIDMNISGRLYEKFVIAADCKGRRG